MPFGTLAPGTRFLCCHTKYIAAKRTPLTAIGIAAGLFFGITTWVPFGHRLLYPLSLFTTWVHEMGHGLTALLVGGYFERLEITPRAGGSSIAGAEHGWPDALVCAGGLLAPALLGALILGAVHTPRRARTLLAVLAAAIVLSLVLYVRGTVGLIALPPVAALVGWAAWPGFAAKPERRVLLAQFLAVILTTDTLSRMVHYASVPALTTGETSDVGLIARNLGGSYRAWGLGITALAVGSLAIGIVIAARRSRRESQRHLATARVHARAGRVRARPNGG